MEESINVIIDDKENIRTELHMNLQPSQKEIPNDVNSVGKSQDESENEVEELPERPKKNRLIKGHSVKDIISNP